MRILHCCLSNFYIDSFGYQENILPKINQKDGHEVMIIASTETYINGKLGLVKPSRCKTETGIPIVRLRYSKKMPSKIARKLRIFPDFKKELYLFKPDVILFHGTCGYEIKTLIKYKKCNPDINIFIDSHEDFHNSARSWLSKHSLYNMYYKPILKKSYIFNIKILYITTESKTFLKEMFDTPEELLEYYPLGGIIPTVEEYNLWRQQVRDEVGVADNDILCIHSGKMIARKKTDVLLKGFLKTKTKRNDIRLILIGQADTENMILIRKATAEDQRIQFLGWKSEDELRKYLCAADIYIQPGSQSATMQNSLCCSCAVMLFPYESHQLFVDGNGYFINTPEDISTKLESITTCDVNSMKQKSKVIAQLYLDYYKIARRIYY